MIDAAPSLRAAKRLSTSTLSHYLRSNGWAVRPSRIYGVAIFSKTLPGSEEAINIVLPQLPNVEDDRRRIADALRTIEAVEEIPISDLVARLANEEGTKFADFDHQEFLQQSIDLLFDRLDKKKGRARLRNPGLNTTSGSEEDIRIKITPMRGNKRGAVRPQFAMTRKQLASMLAH